MREIINLNRKWAFAKHEDAVPQSMPERWTFVNIPYSWNDIDGQDGDSDYYRGTAYFAKTIEKYDLPEADKYYLEINGANSSATVYWNNKKMATHDGGYSTWRVDVTNVMEAQNFVVIEVNNAANDYVYPQNADFTFYGGIYRDVNLIAVNNSHFDLEYYGGCGLKITPRIQGTDAIVRMQAYVANKKEGQSVHFMIKDAEGNVVTETYKSEKANDAKGLSENIALVDLEQDIKNVHLWHGRKDPYLYTAEVELIENDEVIDSIKTRFGCRSFEIDSDRGFILNGEEYPLRGVSRHQDRWA